MKARDALRERWYGLLRFWYVPKLEGRSFFHRMRILLSRNHHADFDLAFETAQNEHLLLNKRTHEGILGTPESESDCPASNERHIQVFLRGFDAGERFALLDVGISEQELENLMPSFVCPSPSGQARRQISKWHTALKGLSPRRSRAVLVRGCLRRRKKIP